MMMFRFISLCLPLFMVGMAWGQNREITKGNKEYNEKRYRNAEAAYREAITKKPGEFTGNYNLGNALYRQEKFEDAAQQYMSAMGNEKSPASRSKAFYNLGNALLRNQQYKEGVEAYKQALKINPDDEDARYNLSYALQKLKQQQQQSNDNKDQKNKDQQKKEQQQKDQQQKEQQQKDQQQQNGQEQRQQQAKKQPKMSKEEAERMLRALKNDEKDLQKEKARKFKAVIVNPEKDW